MRIFLILLSALLLIPLGTTLAQEATITVKKSDTTQVSFAPFQGADGPAIARIVQNDLDLSGMFTVGDAARAAMVVSGSAGGGQLMGKVVDTRGGTILEKSYTGQPRQIAHQFADDIVETVTGTPGIANTRIAFVASRTGRKEIYTADYDGANIVQLTKDNSISVAPAISPDGRRLAYTGYQSGYADIYLVDLVSGSRNRIVKFPGTNSGAAFSPDGGRIAASVSRDGNPELYVMGANGGGARRLTTTRGVESSPSWSPDGSEIVYSSDDSGSPQLFRIPSGGGSPRRIGTNSSYSTEPSWAPDGKKIAFTTRQGGMNIAVLDLQSGSTRVVAQGEDPVWAPNSRHLIYSTGSGLVLLDTLKGRSTPIVTGLGKTTEPTWSRTR